VESFDDEVLTGGTTDKNSYGYTYHNLTKDLDETYDMVQEWRVLIDNYNRDNEGDTRVIFTETYGIMYNLSIISP
jgi:alpha-glucosidase